MRLIRLTLYVGTTAIVLSSGCAAQSEKMQSSQGLADSYVASHDGTLVPADRLEIDGHRMTCGSYPTVLDPHLGDFGAAHEEFVVLNPQFFGGLATPVKLWIFSHECAHLTVGADESKADCAAVQRGRREGWLTPSGLQQVCEFMQPARGDQSHFTGTQRCALMQECFREVGR
jgi:hypothetical protein